MLFHPLLIDNVVQETPDSKTILFQIPTDLKEQYHHLPGQYLTIKHIISGKEIRRAYSICTIPGVQVIGVTVKKLQGGAMSVYLNEKVKPGDEMEVMLPEGNFVVKADHSLKRDHYFFTAGSGITPIMSMVQTILEEEPKSRCYLLYGSRNEDHIIFRTALEGIVKKYEGQLTVTHVLSQPKKQKKGGLSGIFGKSTESWEGLKGRIDFDKIELFLKENPPVNTERHYYLCGPGNFIENAENFLFKKNIDIKNIHKEYFSAPDSAESFVSGSSVGCNLKVNLKGKQFTVYVPSGKTILDVLVEEKKDPPYSCTSGACATCLAKVINGKVFMDVCYALDEDEVNAGYILTCQSRPQTNEVEINYDV